MNQPDPAGTPAGHDLRWVDEILAEARTGDQPAAIPLLWAGIILVGFLLQDHRPGLVPWYWSILGPFGGLVSFLLGWWWSARLGQHSRRLALRHALHWSGMLAAIFLMVPFHILGLLDHQGLLHAILMLVALGYFTAGIYLVRGYLWVGLFMALSNVGVAFLPGLTWTIAGVVIAAALIATALLGRSRGTRTRS